MLDLLTRPYLQHGLFEILAISVAAGVLGTWIVLRGLAFFTHAVATATFPGLVLADGLAFAAPLGAALSAGLFALVLAPALRRRRGGHDSATALALIAALATGVILASDVFHSGAQVDTLLFGSLLAIGWRDVAIAGGVSVLALGASLTLGARWLAVGFDAPGAHALGIRSSAADGALLVLVALAAVASLAAVGALLASALIVVPAATTRRLTHRMRSWQAASVALAAAEGIAGLWLSDRTNAPPGATIAVLGGTVYALVGAVRARRALLLAPAVLLALLAGGCGSSASGGRGLDVVASTTQLGDLVHAAGGRYVSVHQILHPNTDPHEYEPRPSDVRAVAGARLVVESGSGLDGWMDKVVSESGGSPAVFVAAPGSTPIRRAGGTSGPEGARYDPHWWHDPRNAEQVVRAIARRLGAADPRHRAAYARNAAAYARRIAVLDRGIARCFAAIPPGRRRLVTNHDAFGYFAARYGIDVIGAVIPSQTTLAEPSARAVSRLTTLIRREHVAAVFPESSVNANLADAIAGRAGARIGAPLYGDTLGAEGSRGATYLGMEAANADAMARGFTAGRRGCVVRGVA